MFLIDFKLFYYFYVYCSALEQEQQNYLNLVETIAQDLTPLGKLQSEQNNEDSDAESAASDGEHCFDFLFWHQLILTMF